LRRHGALRRRFAHVRAGTLRALWSGMTQTSVGFGLLACFVCLLFALEGCAGETDAPDDAEPVQLADVSRAAEGAVGRAESGHETRAVAPAQFLGTNLAH
jgi:hypothetical protein